MAVIFNGVTLPVGAKQYWGSTQIKDIVFNGVNVWHYDSTSPTLTVTAPSASSSSSPTYTTSSSYKVYGTVSDVGSGVSYITVNGHIATKSGNNWEYTLTGLSSGVTNTIKVVAVDNAGNSTTVTRYLMADLEGPTITVPADVTIRVEAIGPSGYGYSFVGTVSDSVTGVASVTVNGAAVTLNSNNQFYYSSVFYTYGIFSFVVQATDKAGNSSTKTFTVTYRPYNSHSITVDTSSVIGDNGQTSATHTESFLEQGQSRQIDSYVSWAGYLNVSKIPSGAQYVIVEFLGRTGSGSARYTNFSSNIRLTDSDHASMWCNETGRWYYVTATAGVKSITYYD